MNPIHPPFEGIIFDIDNVLIDTRRSYLDAIRWTVEIYLTGSTVPLFRPFPKATKPQLLSLHDVHDFKLLGGFNDDWDCCYGLLVYLLKLPTKKHTAENLKSLINIKAFARTVKEKPLRVSGIVEKLGRNPAVTIEKISRVFQEIYLGKGLFEGIEKKRMFYWKKRGLIHFEKLIFAKPLLDKIKATGVRLGIATGRPRFEALHVLKRFGVLEYFEAMTTMDDVRKAEKLMQRSLRKPHPFSLLETAKKMKLNKNLLYVGDLPDDMVAAHQAKPEADIKAVAFPSFAADPASALVELTKAKPDHVIRKASDILKLLK